MKRANLPYLTSKKVKGRTYWYFRRAEQYVRLPDIEAPEFLMKYEAAKRGAPVAPSTTAKTWRNLVVSYKASPGYAGLADRTRSDYEKVIVWVLATMGDMDPTRMTQPHIIKARDANAERRRFANYVTQVLKILFSHAIEIGWMTHNPANGVKPIPKPKGEQDVHRPWPKAAQEAYRAAVSPAPRFGQQHNARPGLAHILRCFGMRHQCAAQGSHRALQAAAQRRITHSRRAACRAKDS